MNIKKMFCTECRTTKCYLQVTTKTGTYHIDKKGNVYDSDFEDTSLMASDLINQTISSLGCCEKCEEYIPIFITLKDGSTFKSSETTKLSLINW